MNSKPIFHIFGVPDGFDILNGTPDITPYFQRYYNGSEENTKFSIHRDGKGNITYAYLKYNLSSYQSRTGSFFGMSLSFSNEYCTDPMKLYELFDFVYANKVLGSSAEKGLLQKIEVESKIQARYLIPNFGSAKEYIQQEIEFVLLNNITKLFANSFQPISVLFKNDQSHLTAQIPFADANNAKILSLLQVYNRIAISPDWEPEPIEDGSTTPSPKPKIVIAPETIKLYDEYVKNYQSYLIESLANVKAANINDARQGKAEIESVLKNLQSGTSTDQRLPQLITDYNALSGQFAELIQKIADEQNGGTTSSPKPPIPWWKKYLPYISGVAVLVIFIVVLSSIFKKEDTGNKDNSNTLTAPQNHIALARKALHAEDYQAALDELKKGDNNYTQHGLYDSIYNPWITSLLNEQNWNDAWQVAQNINKPKLKNSLQQQIKNACQEHFDQKVNSAKTSNAKKIKEKIKELPFEYNKMNEHINQLKEKSNPPQKTDTGGTGGSTLTQSEQTKSFCIRMQLMSSLSDKTYDKNKTIPIHNDTTISTTNSQAIFFYLSNATSYEAITDPSYKIDGNARYSKAIQAEGWYKVNITDSKNKKVVVKHNSESITITFK